MPTKVKTASPETVLSRILEAFGQELIDASDEEILEVARDLRMDLQKGSAAFAGLTFPARWQPGDFFDMEAIQQPMALEAVARVTHADSAAAKRKARGSIRSEISGRRKNGDQK